MTPWANLQDYSGAMPTLKSDPSGLVPVWAPCVVGAISSFLIDGVVEWFLDSEYTVCEMIFSAIIGCIAGYAPYIGAAKGLKKQIKDAITELGFGIFMGRICEEVYTPDEESLGLSDFLSDPSLLGRQVKKKAKEVVTAGEDYVKKMGDAAEEDRRRRFREKYPKVEEKKDSKCGARERPYDGGDASAWFDPSKVRAGGKLTYEFCVDSCVKGAGLAYTHVEQRCAKSCEQYK